MGCFPGSTKKNRNTKNVSCYKSKKIQCKITGGQARGRKKGWGGAAMGYKSSVVEMREG